MNHHTGLDWKCDLCLGVPSVPCQFYHLQTSNLVRLPCTPRCLSCAITAYFMTWMPEWDPQQCHFPICRSLWPFCPSNTAHTRVGTKYSPTGMSMLPKAEGHWKVLLVSGVVLPAWQNLDSPTRWASGHALGNSLIALTEVEALPAVERHRSLARILVYIKSAAASILCSYSWLWMKCHQLLQAPAVLTSPTMMDCVSNWESR